MNAWTCRVFGKLQLGLGVWLLDQRQSDHVGLTRSRPLGTVVRSSKFVHPSYWPQSQTQIETRHDLRKLWPDYYFNVPVE
jgi:hypothetical protein